MRQVKESYICKLVRVGRWVNLFRCVGPDTSENLAPVKRRLNVGRKRPRFVLVDKGGELIPTGLRG